MLAILFHHWQDARRHDSVCFAKVVINLFDGAVSAARCKQTQWPGGGVVGTL